MSAFMLHRGTVLDYDYDRGLGQVVGEDGTPFPFHCTAIADGTRRIDDGASVVFTVAPLGPGIWEATAITTTAAIASDPVPTSSGS